tara:strand:+ start:2881 stop:4320 length:1440 start_codon:yes stop_codon:yes gene_type:complete
MSESSIVPVILCGGSGSRLWPISRESYPKQFISISSKGGQSLLQKTQGRIKNLNGLKKSIIICNEEHRFIAAEQMRELDDSAVDIILEPTKRNTAPAITVAAIKALEREKDPILLVLSSDHEIGNDKKFRETISLGIDYCEKDNLVTFGVIPNSPETGYGYIKAEKALDKNELIPSKILEFTEKPDLQKAREFLETKKYFWNSGIFMFKAKKILNEIKEFAPDLFKYSRESIDMSHYDLDFQRLEKKSFSKCPNISIDVAVMEKTQHGIVIPLNVNWSDIGSWKSLWETSKKNENGNVINSKSILKDTKNCYLMSQDKLIVGIGIKDLAIIDTDDALLVAKKDKSQEVKNIVQELQAKGFSEGQKHRKIFRPWGSYLSLVERKNWQVKLIRVKPNEQLSLQMHNHRSEHWIVVNGTAKAEINGEVFILEENQSTYIPMGSKHRLSNSGIKTLELIEVQSGSYLGEDDIIRFEDIYGRIK